MAVMPYLVAMGETRVENERVMNARWAREHVLLSTDMDVSEQGSPP